MRVKIGNTWHDAEDEPVMVELNDNDKKNISNMHPKATKYAAFPDEMSEDQIESWMDDKLTPHGSITPCELG